MSEGDRLTLAMIGTRGVPARYGGFETAVEEVGKRLVERGHSVTVYCRGDGSYDSDTYLGMRRIELPALRRRSLETLSHTFLSVVDVRRSAPYDAAIVFNAANAPLVPLLRRRKLPVAIHVDGLESRRAKWGPIGRRYYRFAEAASVRWADALIADARAIAHYYQSEFGATTVFIPYGAAIHQDLDTNGLEHFGAEPGRYHLVVARFEPENHVDLIVRGYRRSCAKWPLLIVGGAPYSRSYSSLIEQAAAGDDRIRLLGPVWDQELLDRLYCHAGSYLHGHSVGGTNPSLLRAMGAGAPVCAYDTVFSREVLGRTGRYFADADGVAALIHETEANPCLSRAIGESGRERAATTYRWDDVASAYERLSVALAAGQTRRGEVSGRRMRNSVWEGASMPSHDDTTAEAGTENHDKP